MIKRYIKPEIEIIEIECEGVLAASAGDGFDPPGELGGNTNTNSGIEGMSWQEYEMKF